MKRLSLLFASIVLAILTTINIIAQTASQPVQYKLTLDPDGTYKVWMKSLNAYSGNPSNKIMTAQVSVVVPTGVGASQFIPTNITGTNGLVWSMLRNNAPTTSLSKDYIVFGYNGSPYTQFDIAPNTDILLLSFTNANNCNGSVNIWETTDAYNPSNSGTFNIGNQISIFGLNIAQGGVTNGWNSNYGTSPVPCNGPPAGIPDLTTTVGPVPALTAGTTSNIPVTVSNIGTGSAPGVITTSFTVPSGVIAPSANFSGGNGWACTTVAQNVTCTNAGPIVVGSSSMFVVPVIPTNLTVNTIPSFSASTSPVTGETNNNNNGGSGVPSQPVAAAAVGCTNGSCVGTANQPISYKLTLDPDGTYKVWIKSVNSYIGSPNNRILTGQVSVVVPHGIGGNYFVPTNVTGVNGMGWNVLRSDQPSINNTKDYIVFGYNGGDYTYFDIAANTDVLLFSFKNNGTCIGPISLWAVSDLYNSSNSGTFNIGNQITIYGLNVAQNSVTNGYNCNYGTCDIVCNTNTLTPNLVVTTNGPSTGTIGSPLIYTTNLTNTGTAPTNGITTVTTPIPAGTIFNGSSGAGWTCSQVTTNVVCTNPNPIGANGGTSSLGLTFTPTQTGTINVTSTVSGGGLANPVSGSPASTTVSPTATLPVLGISLSAPATATLNTPYTYNVTVSNSGLATTTGNTFVTFPLGSSLQYSSGGGNGWTCGQNGSNVLCFSSNPIAANGGSSTFPINVIPTQTGTYQVTAGTSGGGALNAPISNQTNTVVGNATAPNITATLTAPATATQNVPYNYVVNLTNTGTAPTSGVATVTLPIPSGTTFVSGNSAGWVCAMQGSNAVCTSTASIPVSGTTNVSITVNPTITGQVTTTAGVSVVGIPNQVLTNSATTTINATNTGSPNVVVIATVPSTGTIGIPFIQNILFSNTGNAPTNSLLIYQTTLPSGITYSPPSGSSPWTCSQSGQNLTCFNNTVIPSNASSTLVLNLTPTQPNTFIIIGIASGGGIIGNINVNTNPITITNNTPTCVNGNDCGQGVRYKIVLGADGKTYTVYMKSATPYTGPVARIGTAQVTLKVPHLLGSNKFSVINLVGQNGMSWYSNNATRNNAPQQDLTHDYIYFGFNQSLSPIIFNIPAETDIPLFTFQNSGPCMGEVKLWDTSDPFKLPNPENINPGNQMTILGNGTENAWKCNYSCSIPCAAPVLKLVKTAPASINLNSPFNYSFTVNNNGNAVTLGNITIADTLKNGLKFISGNGSGWACFKTGTDAQNNDVVNCTSSTPIAAGGSSSFTMQVNPTQLGGVSNIAYINGGGTTSTNTPSMPCPTCNQGPTGPINVVVNPGDLTISIAQPNPSLIVGQVSNLLVTITNLGTTTANGPLSMTLNLPAGVSTQQAIFVNWTCTQNGQALNCTSPNINGLASNASLTISIPVIPSASTAGTTPTFTANVLPLIGEGNILNNNASLTVNLPVSAPNLVINISSFQLNAGLASPIVINILNSGNAPASGILTINTTLPNGISAPASFTSGNWTCQTIGQALSCTNPNGSGLAPNGQNSLTINVTPSNALVNQNVTIIINVTPLPSESNTTDNSGSGQAQVLGSPILKLVKSASIIAQQNNPFDYALTVSNIGQVNTSGVITVVDTLRFGLKYLSFTGSSWTCVKTGVDTQNNDIVSCQTSTTLLANTGNSSTVNVRVNPTQATTSTNTAYISGGGSGNTPKPSISCNTCNPGATFVIINAVPDVLPIVVTPIPPFMSGQLTVITINIQNSGSLLISSPLTVNFTLPNGLSMPSTFTSGGWTCLTSGQAVTCTNSNSSGIPAGGTIPLIINVTPSSTLVGQVPGPLVINIIPVSGEINTGNNTFTFNFVNPVLPAPVPDIMIALSQPSPNLVVGQQSMMNVTISNLYTTTATGQLTFTMQIPAGLFIPASFSSIGWNLSVSGNTLTGVFANAGGLTSAVGLTFQIPITPQSLAVNTQPIFIASINLVPTEVNSANNTTWVMASLPVISTGTPNLVITANLSGNFAVNQVTNLNVIVLNNGTVPATGNLTVNVTLPVGFSAPAFFTSNGWSGTTSGQNITLTFNNPTGLASGNQFNIVIPVTPNASTGGQIPGVFVFNVNQVVNEIVLIDNTFNLIYQSPVLINNGNQNLVVNILNPNPSLVVGMPSNLNIIFVNGGTQPTNSPITVNMVIPNGLSVPSNFSTNGWTCTLSGQNLSCTNPNNGGLNPTGTTTIILPITPNPGSAGTTPSPLIINIIGNTQNPFTYTFGNPILSVVAPDLTIIASQPTPQMMVGQPSYIQVLVSNIGSATATGTLTVNVTLPSGLSAPANFSFGLWTGTTVGQTVTLVSTNASGLVSGGSMMFFLPVTANSTALYTFPSISFNVLPAIGETILTNNNTILNVVLPVQTLPAPDLSVTISTPNPAFTAGQNSNLVVTIQNVGGNAASGALNFTLNLPSGFSATNSSFVSNGWTCSTFGQNMTCTHPNTGGFAPNAIATINIGVTPALNLAGVSPGQFVVNVTQTGGEVVLINNTTTLITIGQVLTPPIPDLSIILGQPIPNMMANLQSILPVTITNVGNAAAIGVLTFTLQIPVGMTVPASFSQNNWSFTLSGNTLTGTNQNPGGLVPTGSTIFQIPITPSASNSNTKPIFIATINMAPSEIVSINNTAFMISNFAVSAPLSPNLVITGNFGSALIVGQTTNLNIIVSNAGSVAATGGLTVNITLPVGFSTSPSFTSNGWNGTSLGQNVTLTFNNAANLPVGTQYNIVVPILSAPSTGGQMPGIFILNVGQVANEVVMIDNTFNLYYQSPVLLNNTNQNITVNVLNPTPNLTVGIPSNITINLTNIGSQPSIGPITVNMVIPNGLSVPASFSSNGWTCTTVGQNMSCTNPNSGGLPPTGVVNIVLPITPNAGTGGTTPSPITINIVNNATNPFSYNFTTPIYNAPTGNINLWVGQPSPIMYVGQVSYIPGLITNIGSAPVNGEVRVNITLPNGMTAPANFSGFGYTGTSSGNTATLIFLNGLPPGTPYSFMIPVTPNSLLVNTSPSVIFNVIVPSGVNVTNNNFTLIINPPVQNYPAPDLMINVSAPSPVLTANQNSSLTVTVQNIGGTTANGALTMNLTMPAGFSGTPASFTSNGWTCSSIGSNVSCTNPNTTGLTAGASSNFTIMVRPSVSNVGSTPTFTFNIVPVGGEVSTGNNTAIMNILIPVAQDPANAISLNLVQTLSIPSQTSYFQNVPYSYSFVVANTSTTLSSNAQIVVTDTLRSGLRFVSGSGAGWSIQKIGVDLQGNDIVRAILSGNILANSSATFTMLVNPTLTGTIFNQSFISGGGMSIVLKGSMPCTNCPVSPTGPVVIQVAQNFNLSVRAILQGAYVSSVGLMHDSLRVKNMLPLSNPYSTLSGFTQVGAGGETTTSTILATTGNNAIVDWVLVELRNANNPSQIMATKAGLIQRDGDIVGADGQQFMFANIVAGQYHVAIRHRNHLGAMSASPLNLTTGGTAFLDLTNANQPAYKLSGTKRSEYPQFVQGNMAMLWGGNTVANDQLIFQGPNNDVDLIFFTIVTNPQNTQGMSNFVHRAYDQSDVNMDGKTIFQGPNNEVDLIFFNVLMHPENIGFFANYIVWQQLP